MLVGAATVTEFPLVVVTVKFPPEFILYVNVYGAVPFAPVKVTFGEVALIHTAVVPLMLAVGNGLIVTAYAAVVVTHEVAVTVSATVTEPAPADPHVTLIVLVEAPEFIVPPDIDHE